MAFSETEIKRIDRTVEALCRCMSLPRFADELRFAYEIKGDSVSVYEERAPRDGAGEWTRMGVAKFRYVRSRGLWTLYWMRRDLKWHLYESGTETPDLAELVAIVAEDRYGAFFG